MIVRAVLLVAISFALTLSPHAAPWKQVVEGVWVLENQNYVGQENSFDYSAVRIDRTKVTYELVVLEEFIREKYPQLGGQTTIVEDGEVFQKTVRASLSELHEDLNESEGYLGSLSIGYTVAAGSTQLAGYQKLDGFQYEPIWMTPNLTALFCLNNKLRQTLQKFPGPVPSIFPVKYDRKLRFQYLEDLSRVDFSYQGSKDDLKGAFTSCRDVIQVGPRIIEPRDIEGPKGSVGRIGVRQSTGKQPPKFQRTVALYDLFGHLTFIRTQQKANLFDIATLLSSDGFYEGLHSGDKKCPYNDPLKRSVSCELWAVMISGFDDAGIVFDDSVFRPTNARYWGDAGRLAPAALVLKKLEN